MTKKTQQAAKAKVNQKKPAAKVAARGRQPEPAAKEVKAPAGKRDPRIPAPGTVLKREYKGKEHAVKVLADGFEYRGTRYRSLSAIAREIAQCSWNGLVLFGLGSKALATT